MAVRRSRESRSVEAAWSETNSLRAHTQARSNGGKLADLTRAWAADRAPPTLIADRHGRWPKPCGIKQSVPIETIIFLKLFFPSGADGPRVAWHGWRHVGTGPKPQTRNSEQITRARRGSRRRRRHQTKATRFTSSPPGVLPLGRNQSCRPHRVHQRGTRELGVTVWSRPATRVKLRQLKKGCSVQFFSVIPRRKILNTQVYQLTPFVPCRPSDGNLKPPPSNSGWTRLGRSCSPRRRAPPATDGTKPPNGFCKMR